METKYIDLLLVEKAAGMVDLVITEASAVGVGDVVEYNGGTLGHVVMKAWGGEAQGDLHKLITAKVNVFYAEAVYLKDREYLKSGETEWKQDAVS